jgi:pyrroline-5-carboxylate reductase
MQQKIAFIGGGNMASAIIGGLINNGFNARNITVADPYPPSLERLQNDFAVNTTDDNNAAVKGADLVVLAVKPQQMQEVCSNIKAVIAEASPLVLSIAAGITTDMFKLWLGDVALVRAMPNTPALVQTGATGIFANAEVSDAQKQSASELLSAIGISEWVESEALLDAVTAVSGSGPAYFFLLIEAMQAAGEKLGLDSETAKSLSIQTALGAAKMAASSQDSPAELRRKVTSPNGTTEAAIKSFEADGFADMVEKALNAADTRSKTLASDMLKG